MSTVKKMVTLRTCVGCGTCESVCPFGAIEMKDGELGFPIPSINEEKCTDCGECIKNCPFSDENDEDED